MSCSALGQATNNVYQDWVKRCAGTGTFKDRCYVSQQLTLNRSGQRLFTIALGYPLGEQQPLILASTPLGVFLPAGIEMRVDNLDRHRMVYGYCNEDGCHGYYRMSGKLLDEFKRGRWLKVSFQDGTRRSHHFDVSLKGFTASHAALLE